MIFRAFFAVCFSLLFVSTFQTSVVNIACLNAFESTGAELEASRDAIELALLHINSDSGVLPNYTLKVSYRNSGCNPLVGLSGLFEFLKESDQNYQAILGPACSSVTGPVAELAAFYNFSAVTFASTSPSLTNNDRYPLLLLGTPSDINTVSGQLLFIRQQNFRRVAIINQQEDIFVSIGGRLQGFLNELGVIYTTEIFDSQDSLYLTSIELILNRFQADGYRVIVANMYQEEFVNTMCLLRNFPALQPPRTTWIVLGWYSASWSHDVSGVTKGACTLEEIIAVTNGSPAVNPAVRFQDFSAVNETTISGYTPLQIYNAFNNSVATREGEIFFNENAFIYDAYAYDCTWTIALALHQLSLSSSLNLSTDRVDTQKLFNEMQNTTFTGWTGNVVYFDRQRHDGRIQLSEIVDGKFSFRGLYEGLPLNQSTLATYDNFTYESSFPFVYFDPETASDGIEIHYHHISIFILAIIFFLFGVGYVTVLNAIIIFGWVKKYAAVTKSEPSVTITIVSGVYCIFLFAFLWSVDGRYLECSSNYGSCTFLCHFRIWLLAVSISIIFGGMLGKAIKYYVIAIKHKFTYSKYLQFYHILVLPIALTVIDTIYMLVWGLTSPLSYVTYNVNSGLRDPPIYTVSECRSQEGSYFIVFFSILIVMKSLLVLIGLFLAYHLRKVVNKANKYSSIVTWTMYNVLIFSILLILALFLAPNVDVRYGLVCLFALSEGFVVPTIIAGPVVYYMYKDPQGKTFKPVVGHGEFPENSDQLKKKIRTLEGENKDLRSRFSESITTLPVNENSAFERSPTKDLTSN